MYYVLAELCQDISQLIIAAGCVLNTTMFTLLYVGSDSDIHVPRLSHAYVHTHVYHFH